MRSFSQLLQEARPHVPAMGASGGGQGPATFNDPRVPDAVHIVSGSALTPQPINWLWRQWLPLGKLVLLAGQPGVGKTTLAIGLAATVTTGGLWPDGSRCEPGNVLIWSGEDDLADTLLPRLLACGANRDRVHFINGSTINGESVPFDPARDMARLQEAIKGIGGASLLIVDPVVSAVAGDSHKNSETRRALQPLVDLAAAADCCVLGITHFSKAGAGGDPAARVIGSVAFTAVARVVMVAARCADDDGRERRVLARSKSNLGPDDGGFEYHLTQVEARPGVQASRVDWGEAVHGSARELLAETAPPDTDRGQTSADAAAMLREELARGEWVPSATASKPLREAGFSKKQVWVASKSLGVLRKKSGMDGGWYWRLPGRALSAEDSDRSKFPEDSQSHGVEPSESSESSDALMQARQEEYL